MIDHRRHIFTAAQFAVSDRTLSGYAIRWNTLSSDRGGYQVRLLPGSAKFATPTLGLFAHDFANVLSSTANQTLTLTTDDVGVKFSMNVAKTTVGNDVIELVEGGYVAGMSFAMANAPTGKSIVANGTTIFEASSFLCDEISVVVNPAFLDTSVGVPDPLPAAVPNYANRIGQFLQLQRLRFDTLRLAEPQPTRRH